MTRDRNFLAQKILAEFDKFELTVAQARHLLLELGFSVQSVDARLLEGMRFSA
jgi:hypothetical protein